MENDLKKETVVDAIIKNSKLKVKSRVKCGPALPYQDGDDIVLRKGPRVTR